MAAAERDQRSAYIQELAANWRPLLAAMIGLSFGSTAVSFASNIIGPHLLRDFGWSKSDFALLGFIGGVAVIGLPIAGRLADVIGVRRTAAIGVVAAPITLVILSQMGADLGFYLTVVLIQNFLCITTSSPTYSRVVVRHVERARGLALAIAASGPALTIVIGGPLFNDYVASQGWRAGYLLLAGAVLAGGVIALLLVPSSRDRTREPVVVRRSARADYGALMRQRPFWIILTAIILSNMSQFIINTQIGVVMSANGVGPRGLSGMISAFAIGTLIGRFAAGLALDRFRPMVVTAIVMGMPATGQLIIASSLDAPWALMLALLLLGLSYGGEGDVIGYTVARVFGVRIYSTVMGLMVAAITAGSTIGAGILNLTLHRTGDYALFLTVSGIAALIGGAMFLLLPDRARASPEEIEAAAELVPAPPIVRSDGGLS